MKLISAEEYDALMAFMAPKLQSLWEHENEVRESNGLEKLDSFQFCFSIVDIFHYLLSDEDLDFYLIFNETFLHIIYNQLLEAIKKYPNKFGTGNADDVMDALYEVSNYKPYGGIERYIDFLIQHPCCYVVYRKKVFQDDVLRIDLFRLIKQNLTDETKMDFIGGLMHSLKHFSIDDKNLCTGKDKNNVFDIHHIVYQIAMAFRLREDDGTVYTSEQRLSNDVLMLASFYREEETGMFFLKSYYRKD